jgi:hypothetical protein
MSLVSLLANRGLAVQEDQEPGEEAGGKRLHLVFDTLTSLPSGLPYL